MVTPWQNEQGPAENKGCGVRQSCLALTSSKSFHVLSLDPLKYKCSCWWDDTKQCF